MGLLKLCIGIISIVFVSVEYFGWMSVSFVLNGIVLVGISLFVGC